MAQNMSNNPPETSTTADKLCDLLSFVSKCSHSSYADASNSEDSLIFSPKTFALLTRLTADGNGLGEKYQKLLSDDIQSFLTFYKSSTSSTNTYLRVCRPTAIPAFPIPSDLAPFIPKAIFKKPNSEIQVTPMNLKQSRDRFLRKYKYWSHRELARKIVAPIYSSLFDMMDSERREIFFGLGQCYQQRASAVNSHILEIKCEITIASDGALLIHPAPYSGVGVCAKTLTQIMSNNNPNGANDDDDDDDSPAPPSPAPSAAAVHKIAKELFPQTIYPAHPPTFKSIIKKIAIKISPEATFKTLKSHAYSNADASLPQNLVIDDSFTLFSRPPPASIFARDALAFKAIVQQTPESIPTPCLNFVDGPSAGISSRSSPAVSSQFFSYLKSFVYSSQDPKHAITSDFPLPTSASQDQIAAMLSSGAPAVVVEGPPGCGKSHSIANVICHYLASGKRVLVTSKNSSALAVLKDRLPSSLRSLIVDVSVSEAEGMQHLQTTVENLAERVSMTVNTSASGVGLAGNTAASEAIQSKVDKISSVLLSEAAQEVEFWGSERGQQLKESVLLASTKTALFSKIMNSVTVADITEGVMLSENILHLADELSEFNVQLNLDFEADDAQEVFYHAQQLVSRKAKYLLGTIKNFSASSLSTIPLVGTKTKEILSKANLAVEKIEIDGGAATTVLHWQTVFKQMMLVDSLRKLESDVPDHEEEFGVFVPTVVRTFLPFLKACLAVARARSDAKLRSLVSTLSGVNDKEAGRRVLEGGLFDRKRKLVESKIMEQLVENFTPEAASALIKFAQMAAKLNFRSEEGSAKRLTERQQRHRAEYMEAFDGCVHYIPCWIMPAARVSTYLRPKLGKFDLVIVDEASQSDITILPALLRAKQWLIVGDSRQVSPSESFISENVLTSLRATLPTSTFFSDELLPGSMSFFELASQAFPTNRVILSEHFRCDQRIISYCNDQFYRSRLLPLRIPTSSTRFDPAVIDCYIPDGEKTGKVNKKECKFICDDIVKVIGEAEKRSDEEVITFGVISLIGEEQAKCVKTELMDRLGPATYNKHRILCGAPPRFQGAEKDIIYLSLVASKGAVPSQVQNLHRQRYNVAMSRARNRVTLVRSLKAADVSNGNDVKKELINFFEKKREEGRGGEEGDLEGEGFGDLDYVSKIIALRLRNLGYAVHLMGGVWVGGFFVESPKGPRVAFHTEFTFCGRDDNLKEREGIVKQQRVLERVGWVCFRISGLRWVVEEKRVFGEVLEVLRREGVELDLGGEEEDGGGGDEDGGDEGGDDMDEDKGDDKDDDEDNDDDDDNDADNESGAKEVIVIESDSDGDGDDLDQDDDDSDSPDPNLQPSAYGSTIAGFSSFASSSLDADIVRIFKEEDDDKDGDENGDAAADIDMIIESLTPSSSMRKTKKKRKKGEGGEEWKEDEEDEYESDDTVDYEKVNKKTKK